MLAIDIVKEEPRTALEAWDRWLNWVQVRLLTTTLARGKTIEIKEG